MINFNVNIFSIIYSEPETSTRNAGNSIYLVLGSDLVFKSHLVPFRTLLLLLNPIMNSFRKFFYQ